MVGYRFVSVVTLGSAQGKYGGPFDTALQQASMAVDDGHEAVVVAGYLRGDLPPLPPQSDGVLFRLSPVFRLLPSKGFTGLFSLAVLGSLFSTIRKADYVRISVARELIPICALVISRLLSKPVVAQSHGMLTSRTSIFHVLVDYAMRPLIRQCAVLVALTETERDELAIWLGNRKIPPMVVCGNPKPMGLQENKAVRERGADVVFIARLHPRKRVDTFVRASEVAHARGWGEKYAVVGPDEGDLKLVNEAISSGEGNLAYEGALTAWEVSVRVGHAGVFVLTSEREPWGNVLVAALASGVPVVVARSAALAQQVEDAGAGIVVADGDAAGVAEAVHQLLSESAYYETVRANARALSNLLSSDEAQRYTWDEIHRLALGSKV
jgi:glycosyltransferase involved in cell wall biosynthesis